MRRTSKIAMILMLVIGIRAQSQPNDSAEMKGNKQGIAHFITFSKSPSAWHQRGSDETFIKSMVGANKHDEFRAAKQWKDALGFTHKKFQQYYKGIKVENAQYMIHGKNEEIASMNGDFEPIKISSVKPLVSEKEALAKAIAFVGAKKYAWEVSSELNSASNLPQGELLIAHDYLNDKGYKLAWKFIISSTIPYSEQAIYVDARNGNIIGHMPLVVNDNITIVAQTRYHGTVNTTGDRFGADSVRLRSTKHNISIATFDKQFVSDLSNVAEINNNSTSFTSGNWSKFSKQQPGLDVQWAVEIILDYWQRIHNRSSFDEKGSAVIGYINDPSGDNACWDMIRNVISYGEGDHVMMGPFTSLGVCAHEFAHGVNQYSANLNPYGNESGAIMEGLSDVWSTCVKYYSFPEDSIWLMGHSLFINKEPFNCIRNLQNPKSIHSSEGQHPDTYKGEFWVNGYNPHLNSTVFSHWFYLLCNGGSGTNDVGNEYQVKAIGIKQAEQIVYRLETVYLTPNSDFQAARNASIQAVKDLYNNDSIIPASVINAWYAVGVGEAYRSFTAPVINGSDVICARNDSAIYSLSGSYPGKLVSWKISNTNVATLSVSADGLKAVVKKTTLLSDTVLLEVDIDGGNQQLYKGTKTITLGNPFVGGSYTNSFNDSTYPLRAYPKVVNTAVSGYSISTDMQITGTHSCVWTLLTSNGSIHYQSSGDNISFTLPDKNQFALFEMIAQNKCGINMVQFQWLAKSCDTPAVAGTAKNIFTAYPNPARDFVNITAPPDPATIGYMNQSIKMVNVYNTAGNLVNTVNANGSERVLVNVSGLAKGVYILHIFGINNYAEYKKIIVN